MSSKPPRVPAQGLRLGAMLLDEATSRYVVRVRRLRSGDELVLFDPAATLEARATLVEDSPHACRVECEEPEAAHDRAEVELVLVQAAGKGDKLDVIVRDATALGVTRLIVLDAERSVRRLAKSSSGKLERWRRIAVQAARQCGRGDVPHLELAANLGDVLDGALGQMRTWILDPLGEARLGEMLRDIGPGTPLAICVGPEGGWSSLELAAARRLGATRVRAWPHVLRTETAATAALGSIVALRGTS